MDGKGLNHIPNSYSGSKSEKIMTKTMCEKAAASGLTFNHLKCAFAINGYDGLYSIMIEGVDKTLPPPTHSLAAGRQ
jgi:hypothetical protein